MTADTQEQTGFEVLTIEHSGHVATLWLDRPQARNAMGLAFFEELPRAMAELEHDQKVRTIVIAARGPHFSVGLDLKAMGTLLTAGGPESGPHREPIATDRNEPSAAARARATRASVLRLQASISAVADCPKPVIAAVHGYCIGGGVDLISACDIRLASSDAIFSVRETKMAIVADLGSLQRLPGIIGHGHVAELAYTGGDFDAQHAERIGLVNRVMPDVHALVDNAQDLARRIAANSPLAVQGTKAVLYRARCQAISEGLDYVATWNAGHLQSHDLKEAVAAFLEKREPKFEGR